MEDGFHAGLITFKNLKSPTERAEVSRTAIAYCPDGVTEAELTEILEALLALDIWPASYDGGPATVAALKNLTSELIGRFCVAAQQATLAAASESAPHPTTATTPGSATHPRPPPRQSLQSHQPHRPLLHPLRRRSRRPSPAAPRMCPAQGHHGPLRDEPRRGRRGPGPGARAADRTGPRHRARRPADPGPAAAPVLGRRPEPTPRAAASSSTRWPRSPTRRPSPGITASARPARLSLRPIRVPGSS